MVASRACDSRAARTETDGVWIDLQPVDELPSVLVARRQIGCRFASAKLLPKRPVQLRLRLREERALHALREAARRGFVASQRADGGAVFD